MIILVHNYVCILPYTKLGLGDITFWMQKSLSPCYFHFMLINILHERIFKLKTITIHWCCLPL